MKSFASLLLLLLAAGCSTAQGIDSYPVDRDCFVEKQMQPSQIANYADTNARGYNVQRYDLYMDWRAPLDSMDSHFTGEQTITLVLDSAMSEILLDGANMHIDSVRVNGVPVAKQQPAVESFAVTLDKMHKIGDTIVCVIEYTRDSFNLRGLFLYDTASGASQRIAYTMSEPRDAHWWMPCKDDPSDKAFSSIRVLVPPGYSVSSNGLLQGVAVSGAGETWVWKEDDPIATYLMCASASKFSRWQNNYVRSSNAADTVPILYFVWQVDSTNSDSSGASFNSTFAFRHVPAIMGWYSQHFGEFPFPKYGMTPVFPFYYGGMEHQTQTTIHRNWLKGTSEIGIAHEMTHQWFGDNVTCATWKDIWLNEGFATMGEAMWAEFTQGSAGYANQVQRQMNDYLHAPDSNARNIAIYDPEGQGKDVFNNPTTYRKGGVVLHMLRRILGDSIFFAGLRSYQAKFRGQSATTQDLCDELSQFTGQNLQWFFDEWVFGPGNPQYKVDVINDVGDIPGLHVRIVQLPSDSGVQRTFRMPVTLRAFGPSGSQDFLLIDSAVTQTFFLPSSVAVDSAAFDPDNSILKDATQFTFTTPGSSVQDNFAPSSPNLSIQVSPNPSDDHAFVTWTDLLSQKNSVEIVDVLGRVVATSSERNLSNGMFSWDTHNVQAGTYVARLTTSHGATAVMLQVVH